MKSLLNPWILLAIVLALATAGTAGAKLGSDYQIGKQARTELLIAQVSDAAQKAAAEAIAKNKPVNTYIRQKTEETIRENVIYRDCRNDPVVLGLLNDALANQPASEPVGRDVVPDAHAPDR